MWFIKPFLATSARAAFRKIMGKLSGETPMKNPIVKVEIYDNEEFWEFDPIHVFKPRGKK